ncbi:MAG: hypothetical protein NWF14_02755 [Candidatus Bathyarchaeota archaeon]|nr:hypothetical protein [Candidatus Bathyarchaeota archaeon]
MLVLPVKVFEIKEYTDVGFLVQKLRDFREEETYQMESGESVDLVTEILDLKMEENTVSGIFSKDYVGARFYRRELVEAPGTEEAPFWIVSFNDRTFLLVLAPSVARGVKKLLTGNVANRLSRVLFIQTGAIVEVNIPSETLKELHESNPQATKLIWFDEVDIPGVEKLCLAGSDVADTELYQNYLNHGKIWYVVFGAQRRGVVVGITRSCVVTLFSKSTMDEFINYVQQDILKLIQ